MVSIIFFGVSNHLIFSGCTWISTEEKTARATVDNSRRALDQSSPMAIAIHRNTAIGCLTDIAGKLAIKFG